MELVRSFGVLALMFVSLGPALAQSIEEESKQATPTEVALEDVQVKGVQSRGFIEEKTVQPRTETTVSKDAIQKLGGPAQTSIYQTLRLLPSVTVETADPYGLNTRTPFNFRVRGQPGKGTAMTIEGVPVWAQESPGPRPDMLDLENVSRVTLYRGAIPPDKGLGAMNIAGAIDIGVLRPSDHFGVDVRQSFGSYSFLRSFARIDSGTLSTGTKLYASYSYTTADKWRGEGGRQRTATMCRSVPVRNFLGMSKRICSSTSTRPSNTLSGRSPSRRFRISIGRATWITTPRS